MTLKEFREQRGVTRKEAARQSGINLRTLQDYEQGHKNAAGAKGEALYRLGLAPGVQQMNFWKVLQYTPMGSKHADGEKKRAEAAYRAALLVKKYVKLPIKCTK